MKLKEFDKKIKKYDYIIAIDPGKKGAICIYEHAKKQIIDILDIPYKDEWVDFEAFRLSISNTFIKNNFMSFYKTLVVIENQQVFFSDKKNDNKSNILQTLKCYGGLYAMLSIMGLDIVEVAPVSWQCKLPHKKKKTKERVRLFLDHLGWFEQSWYKGPKGGYKDGKGDAIAMALWAQFYLL